jgi:rhodanese-related sulfurtransferase
LRNAKLVESEREGTRVLYRLSDESVLKLWLNLRAVAEQHLPEIGQLRRQYSIEGLEDEIARSALEPILASGDVVLIDVRPALEFHAGHISGALSIPVDELAQHLETLPKDKKIVAYCRGAYCLFADEAVALLIQHGFDAVRLEGGWPEWSAEGYASA